MNLEGTPGEVRITLEIKRAATGETETVEVVGTLAEPENKEEE